MWPSQLEFLKHIADECEFIISQTQGKSPLTIQNDAVLSRALERSLEIIGEAVKNINSDFKIKYPQVDWREMAGMRDKLIHHYFGVDYEIVVNTVLNDIPELYQEVKRILSLEAGE